jgi:creatinine amidohydrolase
MTGKRQTCLGIPMIALCVGIAAGQSSDPPTTREMNLITWTEFKEIVPARVETVLLPTGSLEPHGVIPNGTDNLAPTAMARELAERLNALIAPTLNYGVTPAMAAYSGSVSISAESYQPFIEDVLRGLAAQRFLNIIVFNGHGGNTSLLQTAAAKISLECKVRILVVNWWSLASEDTLDVFGEDGGHAGNNETAYIQAVVPEHIHRERYDAGMAIPNAKDGSWHAYPVPSSILLYQKGQGYPTFDPEQARAYYEKVNNRVAALVEDIISKWDKAGLYRSGK